MKHCPECNRLETDDALAFCRVDGIRLISDSGSFSGDAGTTKFDSGSVLSEIETSILTHETDANITSKTAPTSVLPPTPAPSTTHGLSKPRRRGLALATLALALIIIAVSGYFYFSRKNNAAIQSIAVMPFVNDSGNADVEYLSDGMTETLITSLSQLPKLNVKPRSSVFRYKGKETTTQTIAKELNVEAILNGRVAQRGQDVSLFVELIDVDLDKVVWSRQYNRKQNDLVALQTDIARDVSSRLKTKLSGEDEAKVTKTYTSNPEAYRLYLQGSYYRAKYTEEGHKKAIEYLNKAIEKDPNYALAYADIAASYNFVSDWYLSPNDAMPNAKAAALKAIALDDSLAVAHESLGSILFFYDRDWAMTERELLRSMELDPSSAHRQYAHYLTAMGRNDEAIREGEVALSYAPLDLATHRDLAWFYINAGRNDEAIDKSRKALELEANNWSSQQTLGIAYAQKKDFPEAIAALEKARSMDNNPWISGCLGYVYGVAGRKTDAQKILNELREQSSQRWISPYFMAMVYSGLSEEELTFEWLNRAYETGSLTPFIRVEPFFENLHGDRRFKALLKRLNLPE